MARPPATALVRIAGVSLGTVARRGSIARDPIKHVLRHLPPRRPHPPGHKRSSSPRIRRYHVIPADLPPRGGVRITRQ